MLVQHVGNPKVRDRMAELCVGLAAPCDPPGVEEKILFYFSEKFEGASSLPFAAFMTHDFQWIHGFAGGATAEQLDEHLAIAEASPLAPTSSAEEEQLRKLGAVAETAVGKERWKDVLEAGRDAAEIKGRSDARAEVDRHVAAARKWADEEFTQAEQLLLAGTSASDVVKRLRAVGKAFRSEPEADDAARGIKAANKFAGLAKLTDDKLDAAREKAATEFAGSRWTRLFGGVYEAPTATGAASADEDELGDDEDILDDE